MRSIFQIFIDRLFTMGLEYFGRFYGMYRGTCKNNEDPEEQGRILVRVPAVTGKDTHGEWAWPIMPWAGKDSGDVKVPDVNDPVYVVFENGDPNEPMYIGGWWPKPDGDNFMPPVYKNGKPTKRIFKTKAGHELSFEDDPETQSVKLVWHDAEKDVYSFLAFTEDGSVQWANHKGCFGEFRAADGDERVLVMDSNGNMFTQDKDGTKLVDKNGNFLDMADGKVQLVGTKDFVANFQSINLKAGGVEVGDVATDKAVKGTTWLAWWTGVVLPYILGHKHGTGTGPSTPPLEVLQPPVEAQILTDKLKMQ